MLSLFIFHRVTSGSAPSVLIDVCFIVFVNNVREYLRTVDGKFFHPGDFSVLTVDCPAVDNNS